MSLKTTDFILTLVIIDNYFACHPFPPSSIELLGMHLNEIRTATSHFSTLEINELDIISIVFLCFYMTPLPIFILKGAHKQYQECHVCRIITNLQLG